MKGGVRDTLGRWYGSRLGIVFQSIVIGAAAGAVVVVFRLALQAAERGRAVLFDALRAGGVRSARIGASVGAVGSLWVDGGLWMAGTVAVIGVGLLVGWMSDRRPMIKGSGIPQVKGALLRTMRLEWWPELPMKIVGGILAIGAGLSLGREGPSVQIGAYVGKGVLGVARRPVVERKYLITSGAAAGLAAAFNAPIAGVLFALEELHRHFSPLLLTCAMGASVAGDLVASHFFGLRPVFAFPQINPLPARLFPAIIVLGAVCAFGGDLFKRALYGAQDLYLRLGIHPRFRVVVAALVAIPVGLWLFPVTGGGHELIESVAHGGIAWRYLAVLLVAKVAFTALCYGSGAPGGIFLPLLACGALTGALFGNALSGLGVIEPTMRLNFAIIGMAAFFSAVVRAPITGAILILEMSGNFNHFSGLVTGCLAAFVCADLIKSRPVYDVLMERMVARNPSVYVPSPGRKVILEIPVANGSTLAHTRIRNARWPEGALVVGIERGDTELMPNGATEIHAGDLLLVLANEEHAATIKAELLERGASPH